MTRIRRRKGNRLSPAPETPIVVFAAEKRIEGHLIDSSESGVGVLLPSNSGISEQQSVRLLLQRERKLAKVIRVKKTEEGDQIVLKLN